MRRIALALFLALLTVSPALAQSQTPPPPPPPPTPRTAPPAPTPPARPAVAPTAPRIVAPVQGVRSGVVIVDSPRPAQGQTVVSTVAGPDRFPFARSSQPASWQNVKLDVVISDSLVPDLQNKKAVSMLILDGLAGQVRSSAGEGLINIDARPTIRPDGRIYLQLTIEYRPELSGQQLQQAGLNRTALFSESLALLVTDGKALVASQSADPRSDRKVSIEITASVIK